MISRDEYSNWKNHPVTGAFMSELDEMIETLIEAHFDGINVQDHALMAHQVGMIRALRAARGYSPAFNEEGYMIDDAGAIVE